MTWKRSDFLLVKFFFSLFFIAFFWATAFLCVRGDVRAGFSFCAEMRLARSWFGLGWFGNNLYLWAFGRAYQRGLRLGF